MSVGARQPLLTALNGFLDSYQQFSQIRNVIRTRFRSGLMRMVRWVRIRKSVAREMPAERCPVVLPFFSQRSYSLKRSI